MIEVEHTSDGGAQVVEYEQENMPGTGKVVHTTHGPLAYPRAVLWCWSWTLWQLVRYAAVKIRR